MSTSLRDQLLKAGLVNQKQVRDAERQEQHQHRQQAKPKAKVPHQAAVQHSAPLPAAPPVAPPVAVATHVAHSQSAKFARDQDLNRQQMEKARKKERQAQVKQLIEQNRLPAVEGDDHYNFVDGNKIRRIGVDATLRTRLARGEIAIVRHAGRYDLVPHAIAERIRERDEHAVLAIDAVPATAAIDEAYAQFAVPDDLMW